MGIWDLFKKTKGDITRQKINQLHSDIRQIETLGSAIISSIKKNKRMLGLDRDGLSRERYFMDKFLDKFKKI